MAKKFRYTDGQIIQHEMENGPWLHCMAYGGARSSKTFGWCEVLAMRAMCCLSRQLIVRRTYKDCRQAIGMETWPKMMDICFPSIPYEINKSEWYIELPVISLPGRPKVDKKSTIWLGGADSSRIDSLLGREYCGIFINEASEITNFDVVATLRTRLLQKTALPLKMFYDQNPPAKSHWTYREFELGVNPSTRDEKIADHADLYTTIQMNPEMNRRNIAKGGIELVLGGLPAASRKRFLDGEYQDDDENALWKSSDIDDHRLAPHQIPNMQVMAVGVDPSVSNKKTSDECGIVVAGLGSDGHLYVFEDLSLQAHVSAWGAECLKGYNQYKADYIVAEVNNGGDLVESNIRACVYKDPDTGKSVNGNNILYEPVHATRNKQRRAGPIASLYRRGLVHHVGAHSRLEDEMTSFNPASLDETNEPSPNRMDALVWVLTKLSEQMQGSLDSVEQAARMGTW